MARPRLPEGERAADIAPTGVRLPPALRDALVREATIHRRSLSQEITQRLQASFARPVKAGVAETSPAIYDTGKGSGAALLAAAQHAQLNEHERLLLSLFQSLSPEKQLALLTVLRR